MPTTLRPAPPDAGDDPEDCVIDLKRRKARPRPAPVPPATVDLRAVTRAIEATRDRDKILDLLVAGARALARDVALLVISRGALAGWACSPELADLALFRHVRLPNQAGSVLHEVLSLGGPVVVYLPDDARHAPLLAAINPGALDPPREVTLTAIVASGKPVAVLLVHNMADPRGGPPQLGELARAAGDSIAKMLIDRRRP